MDSEAEQLTFGDRPGQAQRLRLAQPVLAGRLRSHQAITGRRYHDAASNLKQPEPEPCQCSLRLSPGRRARGTGLSIWNPVHLVQA